MESSRTDTWVARQPVIFVLLAIDIALITILIAWGLTEHEINPLARPSYTLQTSAPFVIGWLIMSPLAGAYSSKAFRSLRAMVLATFAGWIGAVMVGVAIRATPLVPGSGDPVFLLVMVAFGLVVMLPWRVLFGFVGMKSEYFGQP